MLNLFVNGSRESAKDAARRKIPPGPELTSSAAIAAADTAAIELMF
jgi:hypothetical protein